MKPKPAGVLLRLGVSLGTIALIVYFLREKLADAVIILKTEVSWGWVYTAVAAYMVTLVLLAIRLLFVFKVQHIKMTFGESFYLGFLGLFFNLFLPSAVGGDIAKAYYAYKYSGKKMASTTSVFLDRMMGFAALILMSLLALAFSHSQWNNPKIRNTVYGLLALLVFCVLFFGSKRFARSFSFLGRMIPSVKWRDRLSDVYHSIHNYRNHKAVMAYCVFLSFLSQTIFVVIHYLLALSLGVRLNPVIFFIFVPMINVATLAPSLGGLGVREAGMIYLFSRFIPSERALALSLLLDTLIYGYSFLGGVIYAAKGGLKQKLIQEMELLQ